MTERAESDALQHATEHLSALARQLQAESEPTDVLRRIVDAATTEIPGAEHVGVTVLTRHRPSTPVRTDEIVAALDAAQYELGEGPCVDASAGSASVRSDDLFTDDRWPRFAPRAQALEVHSVLSLRLWVEGSRMGALNVYARPAGAFPPVAEEIGLPLATHAALAIAAARKTANLETALDSRDVIGQAKGILMERFRIEPDQAFELLVLASQRSHLKLRDLAEHLTHTGELIVPEQPHGE